MLDIRKKLFIFLSLVVAVILLIIVIMLWRRGDEEQGKPVDTTTTTPQNTAETSVPASDRPVFIPPASRAPEAAEDAEKRYVGQLADIFVERFGTYSNQNDNLHIDDIEEMITARMETWIGTQKVVQGEVYAGVTTKVISTSVDTFTSGSATVRLGVQQITDSNGQQSDSYRTARIEMVKQGERWLVDGLYWEDT